MVRIIRDKCLSSDREFELKGNMVLDLPLKSAAANDDSKEYEKLQGTVYLLNPLSGDTLPDPNEKGNRVSDEDKVISSLERFVLGSWRKSAGSSGKQSYPELDQVFKRQQAPGISYFYPSKRIWNIGANYFQCGEKVGKYGWAAVYSGFIVAPFSGKFRFHGYCDDAMVVRFNRKIVLDFGCRSLTTGFEKTALLYNGFDPQSGELLRNDELTKLGGLDSKRNTQAAFEKLVILCTKK